ncbi:hypothetical protein [Aliifodinibius salipaludis]|nr:hypothetical protein [Aliifodinibius salipaludis]
MTYVQTYDTQLRDSRIKSEEAHIAVGFLALEVLVVIAAAGVLFVFFADPDYDDRGPPKV